MKLISLKKILSPITIDASKYNYGRMCVKIVSILLGKNNIFYMPNKPIRTKSRRSTITSQFVGLTFEVYNGKNYIAVHVLSSFIGHKLGEFVMTRKQIKHSNPKILKHKIKHKK